MAELQFFTGTMDSGKSTLALQTNHNRAQRGLVGRIKPVSAFHDDKGRVCRHVVYSLALGTYQRQIEGVACRESDGSWSLSG